MPRDMRGSPDLTSIESLHLTGFAVIRRFRGGMSSLKALEQLGHIDTVEGLKPIQSLTPQALHESPPNTYSGNFGEGDFPLHTDLAHWAIPPRYVALRCVKGSPNIATRIFDSNSLVSTIGKEALRTVLVQPRRPMRNGKQLLRILERVDNSSVFLFRWDSLYLRPATEIATQVFKIIRSILIQVHPIEITLLHPGDTILIDNWRCLHGRSSATGSTHDRRIDRAYMKEIQ